MQTGEQLLLRPRRIHLVLGGAAGVYWVGSLVYIGVRVEAPGFFVAAAVVFVLAVVLWVNYAWYHYVIFGPDSIYAHFYFGRTERSVRFETLTAVAYRLESGGRGGLAPAMEFLWPGGQLKLNLVEYGREWMRPVLEAVAARGVPIDPALALL